MARLTSYNSALMEGVGELLSGQGLAAFSTDPAFAYPADGWAVFLNLTPDKPDRAITLMTYPVEDTDLTNVVTGLQIKLRGGRDPREVEAMSDALYDLLHMRGHYELGGVAVNLSWRQSGAWLGRDGNERIERSENFYLRTERDAPNLKL